MASWSTAAGPAIHSTVARSSPPAKTLSWRSSAAASVGSVPVRPVDGRPQGGVPVPADRRRSGTRRSRPAGVQRAEQVLQPVGELAGGEEPQPGRGEFQGERQAVQALRHPQQVG